MSFLRAEWRKLALANYVIEPKILTKYLPPKTELDTWNDTHYVSLVGFMFLNTQLLGLPIPFHRNFEEVNLRFYVRYKDHHQWKRGVVFIKEIVPKPALTLVANLVYKEHYQTMRMAHLWEERANDRMIKYSWFHQNNEHFFQVKAAREAKAIDEGSEAEFITEHYWGYTKASKDTSFEYEVRHPRWDCYEVLDYHIQVNFRSIYGDDFAALSNQEPLSVMLAEGSKISVENKRSI